MTREEATLVLDYSRPNTPSNDRQFYDDEDLNNALNMAIEALEQKPSNDAVSLASVYEIMGNLMAIPYDLDRNITEQDVSESMDEIRALPLVTPTHKKGHWIESNYEHMNGHRIRQWYCSECGGIHHDKETGEWREVFDFRYAYCPLCGAEMEGEE